MDKDDEPDEFPAHLWAMWRMRHRKDWQPLSGNERSAYNRELRRRLREVPAEERSKLVANLELDWAALPAAQRVKYEKRIGGRAEKAAEKAAKKVSEMAPGDEPATLDAANNGGSPTSE